MILLHVTWLFMLVHVTSGDYTCVCSYNVEKSVYADMRGQGNVVGYMYEFDCKAAAGTQIGQWIPIAFEHKLAYLEKDSQTDVQTCQGEIPLGDRLPTMSTSTTQTTPITTKTTSSSTSSTTTTTTSTMPSTTTTSTTPSTTTTSTTPSTTTTSTTPSTTTTSTTPSTTTTSTTPSTTTTSTTPSTTATSTTPSTTTTSTTPSTTTTSTTPSTTTTSTTPSTTTTSTTLSTTTTTSTPSTTIRSTTTALKFTPITTVTAKTTAPTSTSSYHYDLCPDNILLHAERHNDHAFMYNHLCYEIVPNEKTWRNAEKDCSTRGGHLADIRNASEQSAIYNHLKFYYDGAVWIGLQDHDHEEHFNWTTGAALSYTHWATNRKDWFDHNIEDCVIIKQHGGRWDDVECNEMYGHICQFGVSPTDNFSPLPPLQTTPLSPLSPLDSDGNTNLCTQNVQNLVHHYHTVLTQHGGSCYQLMHNKATWEHGEDLCIKGGGHLVQVNNANEQEYLAAMLKRHNNGDVPVWIGLHDMYNEGEFMWSDDTDVTYTHWMHGSYNNYLGHRQEDCVVIKPSHNYRWDDMPCEDAERHYALCEYDTVQSSGPVIVGR